MRYHRDENTCTSTRESLQPSDKRQSDENELEGCSDARAVASEHPDGSDELEAPVTRHYQRMQRAEESWSKLRQGVLTTTFEKEGSFFSSNRCHFCETDVGNCRCLDCSFNALFCESCAISMHSKVNIFHRVEILRVRLKVL